MGPVKCGVLTGVVVLLAMLISAYLNWTCPQFSDRVTAWTRGNSAYFNMKGRKMFYKDLHTGGGELGGTLVLLHGFPTSSYDWIKLWPDLMANFDRLIAVDFLGHGMSDKPLSYNYTISEQADFVAHLLRAIKVEKFHILAHDYGDTVTQELLHRQNKGELWSGTQILSVCLLNGGVFSETYHIRPMQRLLLTSGLGPVFASLSNRYLFKRGFSEIFGPFTQPSPADIYDFWCLMCHNEGYKATADILDYVNQRTYNNMRWREALSQSTVPVHFIYGPADPVNPPAFVDFYRKMVPAGTIDVLDESVGHYVQWEDNSNVVKLYLQFVRKVLSK